MQQKRFQSARGSFTLDYAIDADGAVAKLTTPGGSPFARRIGSIDDIIDVVELIGMPETDVQRIARTEFAWLQDAIAAARRSS